LIAEIALLILVLGVVMEAHFFKGAHPLNPGDELTLTFGIILTTSHIAGRLAKRINVPAITGYMLSGLAMAWIRAPYTNEYLLEKEAIDALRLIDHLALGLIAFTAGGELKIHRIRDQILVVRNILIAQTGFVFMGTVALAVYAGENYLPGSYDGFSEVLVVSLLLGTLATATSPATTFAVINECKARGPHADVVLATTVMKDVMVILIFAVVVSVSRPLVDSTQSFDASLFGYLIWKIGGSILMGAGLAFLLAYYIDRVSGEVAIVMLILSFLAVFLAESFSLSGLLLCLTAGFVVQNFSKSGNDFVHALEQHATLVYMMFFALAGASIDPSLLVRTWKMTLLFTMSRLVLNVLATWIGTAGDSLPHKGRAFLGLHFTPQAGVSLGVVAIARDKLWSLDPAIFTFLISTIAVNQIIGPVLSQFAHGQSGEAGLGIDEKPIPAGKPSPADI